MPENLTAAAATPETEDEAVIQAIDNSRGAIALASAFGFASIAFYGTAARFSDRLDHVDSLLAAPLALLFLFATPLFLRWPAAHLLRLLHALVTIASLGFFGFLANSLFGSQGQQLLNEEIPVLLAVLPIQIVFIYTYIRAEYAHAHAAALIVGCLGLAMAYAIRQPAALNTGAWYWLLAAFLMTAPICIAFLRLQAELHSQRLRTLGRATSRIEKQNAWLLAMQRRDILFDGLGEQALIEALADNLRQAESTRILLLDIEEFDRLRLSLGTESIQELVRNLTRELGGAMGPGTHWGRWRGRHFIVWNPRMPEDLFEACAGLLEQVLQEADLGIDERIAIRFGQASAGQQPESSAESAARELLQDAWHAAWPERTGRFK